MTDLSQPSEAPKTPLEKYLLCVDKVNEWTDNVISASSVGNKDEVIFASNRLTWWVDAKKVLEREINSVEVSV